jgi:hypothetical protein
VNEDAEFGVFIPLRNGALVQGFPVGLPGLGVDKKTSKQGKGYEEEFSHG